MSAVDLFVFGVVLSNGAAIIFGYFARRKRRQAFWVLRGSIINAAYLCLTPEQRVDEISRLMNRYEGDQL